MYIVNFLLTALLRNVRVMRMPLRQIFSYQTEMLLLTLLSVIWLMQCYSIRQDSEKTCNDGEGKGRSHSVSFSLENLFQVMSQFRFKRAVV